MREIINLKIAVAAFDIRYRAYTLRKRVFGDSELGTEPKGCVDF